MKLILRQKLWLTFVVLTNLVLWAVPSNVVEQIADDRHVMLGRYSRTHFVWNLAVLVLSAVSLYIDSAVGAAYKRRWFQVLAVVFCLLPALILIDGVARTRQRVYYIKDSLAYHRVPNEVLRDRFLDKPEAARTYPFAPPGYPMIEGTLTTDARGFRNLQTVSRADVVVLGDSFAEGSGVSDEHTWPALLAARTGLTVCNLGMSGYDPLNYLESLKQFGLALRPRYVLCMLYEGNDFRSAKSDEERVSPDFGTRLGTYFKQSPLIGIVDRFLIETFGPLRCTAPVAGAEFLDWLPLAVGPGPQAPYYAFAPKQLADLYRPPEDFAANRKWQNTRRILEGIQSACAQENARLMVIYAPTKAHVTLPLALARVESAAAHTPLGAGIPPLGAGRTGREPSPEKLRRFLALEEKEEKLPDAAKLMELLPIHVEGRESVVAKWCQDVAVEFVSTTPHLRQAASEGRQVYFTYDQHWSPVGHQVVAELLAGFMENPPRN